MLMSSDLFLDCVLYVINDNTERSRKLILELITIFENNARTNTMIDDEVTRFYIRILKSIMDAKVTKNNPDELRIILLKFQSDQVLAKRKEIYTLLHETFLSADSLAADKLSQLYGRINNTLLWYRCNNATKSQYAALSRAADMINPLDQAEELRKILTMGSDIVEAFTQKNTETTRPRSLIEQIDMTDKESMQAAIAKHKERSVAGTLRLGLAGLNRMCGEHNGIVRGESVVIYALPHHYKSGLIMSIASWIPLYNTPSTSGEKAALKKLVLLISLENEAHNNFVWMFRHHYETINQMSSKHLTDEEATTWAYDLFSASGFTLVIERHLPYKFDFQTYVQTVEYYENSGYEVVLAAIDYVNLMEKTDTGTRTEGGNHLAVRAVFSALCNYNKTKAIAFITAHPLNRDALKIAASGQTNVVRRLDASQTADSMDVGREVDLELFIHIERNMDGVPYLTMRRGKHRYVDTTPEAHKYCAYRFHAVFGIRDDVLRNRPEFVSDIYDDPLEFDSERGIPSQPVESATEESLF